MLRRVIDRIGADLVRHVIMRPQHVGDRGIAVDDFQPHATALLETVRHRLDADVETVDFSRLDRLRIGVRVIRLNLGRFLRIERAVRGAQPAFGDPE